MNALTTLGKVLPADRLGFIPDSLRNSFISNRHGLELEAKLKVEPAEPRLLLAIQAIITSQYPWKVPDPNLYYSTAQIMRVRGAQHVRLISGFGKNFLKIKGEKAVKEGQAYVRSEKKIALPDGLLSSETAEHALSEHLGQLQSGFKKETTREKYAFWLLNELTGRFYTVSLKSSDNKHTIEVEYDGRKENSQRSFSESEETLAILREINEVVGMIEKANLGIHPR